MFLFILLCQIQSQQIKKNCEQNMDYFQIKDNHYCVRDHYYAPKNQDCLISERQNKLQAIVNQIEDLINKKIYLSQAITPEYMITNKFTSSRYLNFETENILLIQIAVFYQVHKGSLHYDPPKLVFILEISKKLQPNNEYEGNAFDNKILLQEDESYEIIVTNIYSFTIFPNICIESKAGGFHLNDYFIFPQIQSEQDQEFTYCNLKTEFLSRLYVKQSEDKEHFIRNLNGDYLGAIQKPFSGSKTIYLILFFTFYSFNILIFLDQPSDDKDVKSQNSEQPSQSDFSEEVFSDYTDEFSDSTMIEEDIFINSENNTIVYSDLTSEIDKNSFYLSSQGESLEEEEDQILKYKEERVGEKRNQVNAGLFQRVKFTLPEGCWGVKDPIFLPQDSDEEMVDYNTNQRSD